MLYTNHVARDEFINKPLVQKAFAITIRYDVDGSCKLLVLELKSVGYEFYRLPGGNVEANETPLQAAYRETYEESGIDNLQFIRKIGTTRYFKPFIQSEVERTDYLFRSRLKTPCRAVFRVVKRSRRRAFFIGRDALDPSGLESKQRSKP